MWQHLFYFLCLSPPPITNPNETLKVLYPALESWAPQLKRKWRNISTPTRGVKAMLHPFVSMYEPPTTSFHAKPIPIPA